jgi:hypothetical protein
VSRATVRFIKHYAEMVAVMFAGMIVLGIPFGAALAGAGISTDELHTELPALMLLGMGFTMTAPMIPWMRWRGHRWQPTLEMAASMVVPTLGVVGLLAFDLVDDIGALLAVEHVAMFGAMLAVMLMRRGEYSHHAHQRVAA